MSTEYDTRTYFDKAGVERWVDDDTVINQNGPFRKGPGGIALEVAKMAQAARNAAGTSRAVSRDSAAGKNRGTLRGVSRKADDNMLAGIPDVYAQRAEKKGALNFASLKREGMPPR